MGFTTPRHWYPRIVKHANKVINRDPSLRVLEPDTTYYQCVTYARGEITEAELLNDLCTTGRCNDVDDLLRAMNMGFIDEMLYADILTGASEPTFATLS